MDRKRITVENPYRAGSKLHKIYEFMADGKRHSLEEITYECYGLRANSVTFLKRRTASALRTIRNQPKLFVYFNGSGYRLVGWTTCPG